MKFLIISWVPLEAPNCTFWNKLMPTEDLIQKAEEADVVLEIETNDLQSHYYNEITLVKNKPRCFWMIDTYLRKEEFSVFSHLYDYLFVSESRFVGEFDKPTKWLPLAEFRSPSGFWPGALSSNCKVLSIEKDIEVGFCGRLADFKPYRTEVVNYLNQELPGFRHETGLSKEEMVKFINRCKINLNVSSSGHQVDLRVFEVLACQGFLITSYNEDTESLFVKGKHLEWFKKKEEIPELVEFYLNRPEKRREIAVNGYQAVKMNHQLSNRLEAIEKYLKS